MRAYAFLFLTFSADVNCRRRDIIVSFLSAFTIKSNGSHVGYSRRNSIHIVPNSVTWLKITLILPCYVYIILEMFLDSDISRSQNCVGVLAFFFYLGAILNSQCLKFRQKF